MFNIDENLLNNLSGLLKNSDFLKKSMDTMKKIEVIGESGGGFVKVKLTGDFKIKEIIFEDNEFIKNDLNMLIDLIISAQNDAVNKITENFGETFK